MDKYDEMITDLEKQLEELKQARTKIQEAKMEAQAVVPKCKNCNYYHQYFRLWEEEHIYGTRYEFHRADIGKCVFPRMKERKPDDICKYFEPKEKKNSDKYSKFVCPGGYAYK